MSRSRRGVVDAPAADRDLAVGDRLEAGEHPQRRGLARAGGADQHHELAVGDREVERADGLDAAEALGHAVEGDRRHQAFIPSPRP